MATRIVRFVLFAATLVGIAFLFTAIGAALTSPSRGAEAITTPPDQFVTAEKLKLACEQGNHQCGVYVFGVLDTIMTSLDCKGGANNQTAADTAKALRQTLDLMSVETLSTVSGAQAVSMAFSLTPTGQRCIREAKKENI